MKDSFPVSDCERRLYVVEYENHKIMELIQMCYDVISDEFMTSESITNKVWSVDGY